MSDTSKFIRTGDFCKLVSDKFEDNDVKRGHLLYVAGHKPLPISEEDPYTQRIKFFVHLVSKDGRIDTTKLYLMDANSMQKVGSRKKKQLLEIAKADENSTD